MKMNKPVIKEIKRILDILFNGNDTAATRVDFGLNTMQAINFLPRPAQYLTNHRIPTDLSLLQMIAAGCDNLYKYVHHHSTQTKAGSYMAVNSPEEFGAVCVNLM